MVCHMFDRILSIIKTYTIHHAAWCLSIRSSCNYFMINSTIAISNRHIPLYRCVLILQTAEFQASKYNSSNCNVFESVFISAEIMQIMTP